METPLARHPLLILNRLTGIVRQKYWNSCYRALLKNLGSNNQFSPGIDFRHPQKIRIDNAVTIKGGCIIDGRSQRQEFGIVMGPETYLKEGCYLDAYGGFIEIAGFGAIGQSCMLHGNGGLRIGKYAMIGGGSMLLAANHNYFSLDLPYILQGGTSKGIRIGDNVWIGAGSIVLDGVTIGNNSIVAAGSIVKQDIPSGSLMFARVDRVTKELRYEEFRL